MAVLRDRPYHQFNFLVGLGTGETAGVVDLAEERVRSASTAASP